VLAYHYLVAGHVEDAVKALQQVVDLQPEDQVARKMLDSLQPAESVPATPPPAPVADETSDTATDATASDEPTTDLVGKWRAQREGDTFELEIDDEASFRWKATPKNADPVELSGPVAVSGDMIVLETAEQGSMVARVKSGGPDSFQFTIAGASADDPGLEFRRLQ
jgi:hypothetical protein